MDAGVDLDENEVSANVEGNVKIPFAANCVMLNERDRIALQMETGSRWVGVTTERRRGEHRVHIHTAKGHASWNRVRERRGIARCDSAGEALNIIRQRSCVHWTPYGSLVSFGFSPL